MAYPQLQWSAGADGGSFYYSKPVNAGYYIAMKGTAQAAYTEVAESGEYSVEASLRPEFFAGETPFAIIKGVAELKYEGDLLGHFFSAAAQNRYYRVSQQGKSLLSNVLMGSAQFMSGKSVSHPQLQVSLSSGTVGGSGASGLRSAGISGGYESVVGMVVVRPTVHFFRFSVEYTPYYGQSELLTGWGGGVSTGLYFTGSVLLSCNYSASFYKAPFLSGVGVGHDVSLSAGGYVTRSAALLIAAAYHKRNFPYTGKYSSRGPVPVDPIDLENRVSCILSWAVSPASDVNFGFGYILQDMTKFGYYFKGTEWTVGIRVSGGSAF